MIPAEHLTTLSPETRFLQPQWNAATASTTKCVHLPEKSIKSLLFP